MTIRMTKPWRSLVPAEVMRVPGQLGVYALGDESGATVAIGYAGGRSLFGLRGVLDGLLDEPPATACRFRIEITMAYLTRYRELLMLHVADHGSLPLHDRATPPVGLGRLSPL